MEEEFRRVFGEGTKEVVEREVGEEAVRAKARKTEPVPSQREVEEHNLDHGVFRSWCPHCVKGRAESYGHVKKVQNEGDVPTIGIDYMYMHSEQEMWQDKMRRLEAHGEEFRLAPVFKINALRTLMIGKSKEYFDLWESDKDHTDPSKAYEEV